MNARFHTSKIVLLSVVPEFTIRMFMVAVPGGSGTVSDD
jgi:hypothetical protein